MARFGEHLPLASFSPPQSAATADEVQSLGVSLGPALHEACGDKLGDIEWFRSPWQRSGAATGRTWWRLPSGEMTPAIVKVPVGYREYRWSIDLGAADPMRWLSPEAVHLPVPRVLAGEIELGGHDLAWLVIEKVPGTPLNAHPSAAGFDLLFEAAARFHQMAGEVKALSEGQVKSQPAWDRTIAAAVRSVEDARVPNRRRWMSVLRRAGRAAGVLAERWDARPIDSWCHGDLHPGNVMIRDVPAEAAEGPGDSECGVLLDLAMVHTGCWIEDALYVERIHWGREEILEGREPLEAMARERKRLGLMSDPASLVELPDVRRTLMAATTPAFLHQEGDPVYLTAALERLEGLLPKFGF